MIPKVKYCLILISLLICDAYLVFSQKNEQKSLEKKIYAIKNIDQDNLAFSDFVFVDSVLSKKRIIFLGEAQHSDGTTLKIKSQLIEYLIEKHDYNVIVFERNFFEMDKMNDLLHNSKYNLRYVLMEGFKWRDYLSEGSENLFSVIQKYKDNIKLAGVEIAYGCWYRTLLEKDFLRFEVKKKIVRSYCLLLFELNALAFDDTPQVGSFDFREFYTLSNKLLIQLRQIQRTDDVDFLHQVINNNLGLAEWVKNRPPIIEDAQYYFHVLKNFELRDKYMAKNLLWLLTHRYPDKKIIVTTSTLHMSKDISKIPVMADYLPDSLRKQSYFLPFVSYHGRSGFDTDTKIFEIEQFARDSSSLEYLFHSLSMNFGFLDFGFLTNLEQQYVDTFEMSPSPALPSRANWSKVYDGIFFIDTMAPDLWKPLILKDYEYLENVLYKHKD